MIKKRKFTISAFISLVVILIITSTTFTSCYYDNEETLYPETPCDTVSSLSYSSDIVPVLSVNCYSCHSIVNAPVFGDGLVLEGYANLVTYLNNEPDVLLNSVKQNGLALSMPRDGSKLAKCSISDLEIWIKQGKRNN